MQTWTSLPKSSNAAIVQVKESEKDLVVIISKSVTLALLQIALCDPNFTVSGYLGGTVTDSYIHISHLTCHRILRDALTHTDSVLTEAYNEAIAKFNSLNLSCLGWWKTVDPIYPLAPVLFDVARQAALESIFPFSVCLLVHGTLV